MPAQKPHRNSPCPCGSGKKYKRCCLKTEAATSAPREESGERVVLCWALDRVRQRISSPQFERRLYQANSEQARFLLRVCAEAGSIALPFGARVFEAAIEMMKDQPLERRDLRGLVLGFHAKTLDELIGVRALTRAGSLGPAMAAVRVLFETYVFQTYLLQADSDKRAEAYRQAGLEGTIKDTRERCFAAGPSASEMGTLFNLIKAKEASDPGASAGWPGRSILQLAQDIDLRRTYASLYRMASAIIHARDADEYNPIAIAGMMQGHQLEQPYFLTGYGFWSAGDALSLAGFLDTVPICLFGNTAEFLKIELDSTERELVAVLGRVLHDDTIGLVDDLRVSFPDIVV